MKVYNHILILKICLFCVSCSSNPGEERPDWIDNPGLGVSASCVTHVKGRHFQEELAVARARERLAARYGVGVSSKHVIKQEVKNGSSYVKSSKHMSQVVKNKEVKARVRDKWRNTRSDVLWVWLYPIN